MDDETERALDAYLIVLIQGGSREAFDRLARRWTPKLVRYAARVLGRQDIARDVVQEAWVGAIRGVRQLDDPSRFPAWIYSITHRKCVDGIRLDQRQRRLRDNVSHEAAVAAVATPARAGWSETADIPAAISHLSSEQRNVVHLFYGEGLRVDEIASILGVPPGTVKSRLHHAREALKSLLGE